MQKFRSMITKYPTRITKINMNEKNSSPVTMILSHRIKSGHVKDYENWSKKITAKASVYDGFQNVMRINPSDPMNPEYVVIVS